MRLLLPTHSKRSIGRDEWNALCERLRGEAIDAETVTVRGTSVDVTTDTAEVAVYPHQDATDVRVGSVQILIARDEAVVLVARGSYPISQWDVLWEGRIDGDAR